MAKNYQAPRTHMTDRYQPGLSVKPVDGRIAWAITGSNLYLAVPETRYFFPGIPNDSWVVALSFRGMDRTPQAREPLIYHEPAEIERIATDFEVSVPDIHKIAGRRIVAILEAGAPGGLKVRASP